MRVYADGRTVWNAEDQATFNRLRNREGALIEVNDHIERNKEAKRARRAKRYAAFVAHAEENGGVEKDPEVLAFREIQEDLGLSTGQVFRALSTVEVKPLQRRAKKPTRR